MNRYPSIADFDEQRHRQRGRGRGRFMFNPVPYRSVLHRGGVQWELLSPPRLCQLPRLLRHLRAKPRRPFGRPSTRLPSRCCLHPPRLNAMRIPVTFPHVPILRSVRRMRGRDAVRGVRSAVTVVITLICVAVRLTSAKSPSGGKRRGSALNTALRSLRIMRDHYRENSQ